MSRLVKFALVFAFCFGASTVLVAQVAVTFSNDTTWIVECGEFNTFTDGFGGSYGPNISDTMTVCSDGINGLALSMAFAPSAGGGFDIHESDTVYFFDGPDVNSPLIGAYNNGTQPFNTLNVFSSIDNWSGCITILFVSDGSDEASGFAGEITCQYDCQPMDVWFNTSPAIVPNDTSGTIDICLGDPVDLSVVAGFPMSPTNGGPGYEQTMATSTVTWSIFGEADQTGESISYTPAEEAGYFIDVVIEDAMGCQENIRTVIRVATTPNYGEMAASLTDTICPGASTTILAGINTNTLDTAGVAANTGSYLTGGLFSESLELPDGATGTLADIYTTPIEITGTPGDTIYDGTNIVSMCVEMEHSFLGDLEMWLKCPNGDSVVIFNAYNLVGAIPGYIPGGYDGGNVGINLGEPNFGVGEGVCYNYCWSMTDPDFGTFEDEYDDMGSVMTAGTYLPEFSFDSLIGCPIDGEWSISVADNWDIDDGWICSWSIQFIDSLDPAAVSYTPIITDIWWDSDPTIINNFGDTLIEVHPPNPGDFPYTLNVVDEFGCHHDTTVIVHVDPPLAGTFGTEDICALTYDLQAADSEIFGGWVWTTELPEGHITWSPDSLSGEATVTASEPGIYQFTYESACGQIDSLDIVFNAPPDVLNWTPDTVVCPGDEVSFDAGSGHIAVDYDWNVTLQPFQHTTVQDISDNVEVIVVVSNDCGVETDTTFIYMNKLIMDGPDFDCEQTTSLIANNTQGTGSWTYEAPDGTGGTADFLPGPTNDNPDVEVDQYGLYKFIYNDDLCGLTDTVEVTFYQNPAVAPMMDTAICIKDTAWFDAGALPGVFEYDWNTGDTSQILTAPHAGYYSVTASGPCGEATSGVTVEEWDCSVVIPSVFNPNSTLDSNKVFLIPNLEFHPGNEVTIFDRWGRKCYQQAEYQNAPWTGEGESSGVFYWVLNLPQIQETQAGYIHLMSDN